MPKIPTITAGSGPTAVPQQQKLTAADFGGDQGLRSLGAGISAMGSALHKRQARKEQQDAHKIAADTRVRWTEQLTTSMSEASAGAEGFTDAFAQTMDKDIEGQTPDFQTTAGKQAYQQQMTNLKTTFMQKAILFEGESAREKAINDYSSLLNNGRNTVLNDPSQFHDVLKDQHDYINTLSIDDNKKDELFTQAKRELALSSLQREILLDAGAVEKELLGGSWDKYIDADDKARMLASIESAKAGSKSEANAALRRVEDRMREGLDLPGEEMSAVNAVVMGTGDAEIINKWQNLQAIRQQNSGLRALRPSDVQLYIDSRLATDINTNAATDREYQLFDAANTLLGKMRTEIKKDPLTWAARSGAVQLNDVFAPGGYAKRGEIAAKVAGYYGVETNPLTASETAELAQRLKDATPREQLQELSVMVNDLGDLAPDALSQLDQADGAMAQAGALMVLSPETHAGVALQILEGHKMIQEDKKVTQLLGGETGAGLAFTANAQGAFKDTPRIGASVRAATNALYIRMAAQQGETAFNQDIYDQAMSLVLGGNGSDSPIAERNGASFVLPMGMNDSQFDDMLENLKPEDLAKNYSDAAPKYEDGTVATPAEIEDEGHFHFIGNGRYLISMHDGGFLMGNGPQGYYVLNVTPESVTKSNRARIDAAPAGFPGGS